MYQVIGDQISNLPCDLGTYTQTFTGEEPLTILLKFTYSFGAQDIWPLVINLSKTNNTKAPGFGQ